MKSAKLIVVSVIHEYITFCFGVFHLLPEEDYDTLVEMLFSTKNYCRCPVSLSFRACFPGVKDVVQIAADIVQKLHWHAILCLSSLSQCAACTKWLVYISRALA